ncbi:Uncharacterised protein [uncultured archaeon]|nr:Uncharacterised protein [uncultured archaeon]
MIHFIKNWFDKIKEINRKYSTPRIKMTRAVKIALFMLRLYLIILVLILVYKFLITSKMVG